MPTMMGFRRDCVSGGTYRWRKLQALGSHQNPPRCRSLPQIAGMHSTHTKEIFMKHLSTRLVIGAFLSGLLLGQAFAMEDRPISKAARDVLWKGAETALAGCSRPLPAPRCPGGALLRASKPQVLQDNNSGDKFSIQDAYYPGMSFTIRAKEVISLELTGPNWPVPLGLTVGADGALVRQKLGRPSMDGTTGTAQSLSYCERENCVAFLVDAGTGRISRVSWSFYYD